KVAVLGQEPVARMDRIGTRLLCRPNVLLGVQVARDLDRFVRRSRVKRALVVGRDDRDDRDPLGGAGPEDAERDLAAVGYEELPEHGRQTMRRWLGGALFLDCPVPR